MAQFDLYTNDNPQTSQRVPYLLDIQNDLFDDFTTRLVIPIVRSKKPLSKLNPVITLNNEMLVISTQEMAAIPIKLLHNKVISLADHRQEILDSVDFLVVGF